MHNKGRKNLHKYLMQASSADEVTSSHAYGRVAKNHKVVPKRKTPNAQEKDVIAGYQDSMVGSINQYRSGPLKVPERTEKKEAEPDAVIGNRPRSGASDAPKADAAAERRHHFIEPPKRGFNRFG